MSRQIGGPQSIPVPELGKYSDDRTYSLTLDNNREHVRLSNKNQSGILRHEIGFETNIANRLGSLLDRMRKKIEEIKESETGGYHCEFFGTILMIDIDLECSLQVTRSQDPRQGMINIVQSSDSIYVSFENLQPLIDELQQIDSQSHQHAT